MAFVAVGLTFGLVGVVLQACGQVAVFPEHVFNDPAGILRHGQPASSQGSGGAPELTVVWIDHGAFGKRLLKPVGCRFIGPGWCQHPQTRLATLVGGTGLRQAQALCISHMPAQATCALDQAVDRRQVGHHQIEIHVERLLSHLGGDQQATYALVGRARRAELGEHGVFDVEPITQRKTRVEEPDVLSRHAQRHVGISGECITHGVAYPGHALAGSQRCDDAFHDHGGLGFAAHADGSTHLGARGHGRFRNYSFRNSRP